MCNIKTEMHESFYSIVHGLKEEIPLKRNCIQKTQLLNYMLSVKYDKIDPNLSLQGFQKPFHCICRRHSKRKAGLHKVYWDSTVPWRTFSLEPRLWLKCCKEWALPVNIHPLSQWKQILNICKYSYTSINKDEKCSLSQHWSTKTPKEKLSHTREEPPTELEWVWQVGYPASHSKKFKKI